jgi:hypothetical protein
MARRWHGKTAWNSATVHLYCWHRVDVEAENKSFLLWNMYDGLLYGCWLIAALHFAASDRGAWA